MIGRQHLTHGEEKDITEEVAPSGNAYLQKVRRDLG